MHLIAFIILGSAEASDTRILCLIGAGDNTKSTLLTAIEWIVYPTWNLQACDMDFYNCNTDIPIVLRGIATSQLGI